MPSPFDHTSGPRDARIIIVGEAWGEQEAYRREPFVGYSGKELDRILFDAGLNRASTLCTNLVNEHPPANDFSHFLERTQRGVETMRGVCAGPTLRSGYTKLTALIDAVKPHLIIGCGNWPLWALTPHAKVSTQKGFKLPSGIMKWRGSQTYTEPINGTSYPYLPIIHPSAVMRDWSLRHVVAHDLRSRAARFLAGKTAWTEPNYNFEIEPDFKRISIHLRAWLRRLNSGEQVEICCDVETYRRKCLTVIGLADADIAICIPFFYFDDKGDMVDCFTAEQETELLSLTRQILQHPSVYLTNQNIAYDAQFLRRAASCEIDPDFDTMLGHHLLYPGTPKSLDYLASLYCEHYLYWKDESQDWDAKGDPRTMWKYNCKDTRYTFEITQVLRQLIAHQGWEDKFAFQLDQWRLSQAMTNLGVNWDRTYANSMRGELAAMSTQLGSWLSNCMPADLQFAPSGKPWYSSNSHSQYIIYDRLGIEPVRHKKTKQPTLDKESFETLKKRAPWLSSIFDNLKLLRSVDVFKNNFLEARLSLDGRMRASFNIGGTETFRWSSSTTPFDEGLNLQNIPTLKE